MIRYVPNADAPTSSSAQNAGNQTGYGGELEAEWQAFDTLKLLGNYAYQQSTNETLNHDAGDAPHHQVYLRANWEFLPNWQLSPQAKWIIDRDRMFADARSDIADYTWVDLTLRRKRLLEYWEMAFSIRNLFDVDAREPSSSAIPNDLPLAGRSFYGEIRVNF
jgi:iron complex outermembrane receptor protein